MNEKYIKLQEQKVKLESELRKLPKKTGSAAYSNMEFQGGDRAKVVSPETRMYVDPYKAKSLMEEIKYLEAEMETARLAPQREKSASEARDKATSDSVLQAYANAKKRYHKKSIFGKAIVALSGQPSLNKLHKIMSEKSSLSNPETDVRYYDSLYGGRNK